MCVCVGGGGGGWTYIMKGLKILLAQGPLKVVMIVTMKDMKAMVIWPWYVLSCLWDGAYKKIPCC